MSGAGRDERLRFTGFNFKCAASGICDATVELEWTDGAKVTGSARGQSSPFGDVRIAAEAAVAAVQKCAGPGLRLDLVGVKAVRAFDATVIIVSLHAHHDGQLTKLLGSALAERDQLRTAALAVLNATNRVLGNFLTTR